MALPSTQKLKKRDSQEDKRIALEKERLVLEKKKKKLESKKFEAANLEYEAMIAELEGSTTLQEKMSNLITPLHSGAIPNGKVNQMNSRLHEWCK